MYCRKCGNLINENEKYCSRCGSSVVNVNHNHNNNNNNNNEQLDENEQSNKNLILSLLLISIIIVLLSYTGIIPSFGILFILVTIVLAIYGNYKYPKSLLLKILLIISFLMALPIILLIILFFSCINLD